MAKAPIRISLTIAALLVGASGCGRSSPTPPPEAGDTSSPSSSLAAAPGNVQSTATTAAPDSEASTPPAAGSCHARGSGQYVLPDPTCTPGVTNPAVSQADIDRTICASGWTKTVRPPESYTEPLKYQQMAAYGETGSAGSYEEDHLIPLELGGSPTSPQNLWPQPGATPNPKDAVEDAAKHAVCDGQIELATAQKAIAADWIAFGRQLGSVEQPTATSQAPSGQTATCTASASYNSSYSDWDVYVHSNQPDQTVTVTTSGGVTASYHTNGSGYADVYLHAPQSTAGQRVTVTVGGATCLTTL